MEIQLTKDSDALICLLYKSYLEGRKNGDSRENSKQFGDIPDIQSTFVPNWLEEDVLDCCFELGNNKLISYTSADNTVMYVELTNLGIIYMESRFENKVNSILDYINKIKSIITPF